MTAGVHGFPVVLTSFVSRAGEVREVAGLLEESRLVTVTGPGGVGKTRLAGEVARQVAARFADGAWLAELAPVQDPARVPAVVAVALGVREQPGMPAAAAVARVLARRQLLVVLDNCEHVIGAAAQLCAGLLQACDDVRVLATSREPLRIAGEAAYRLAPLPVPGPGDDMAGAEAVALFADRARAADAGFALTGENRADVARLVGRLDGMPLAIELAAARAEALGVSQLLGWLDDRLELPAGGDRLAAGRHRSLAAAADWSYQLPDPGQDRLPPPRRPDPAGAQRRARLTRARAAAGSAAPVGTPTPPLARREKGYPGLCPPAAHEREPATEAGQAAGSEQAGDDHDGTPFPPGNPSADRSAQGRLAAAPARPRPWPRPPAGCWPRP